MTNIPFYLVAIVLVAAIWDFHHLSSLPRSMREKSRLGASIEKGLICACHGGRSQATSLIEHEINRKSDLYYKAVALLALSRLRDDAR